MNALLVHDGIIRITLHYKKEASSRNGIEAQNIGLFGIDLSSPMQASWDATSSQNGLGRGKGVGPAL